MDTLAPKLALSPLLILAATLAGRRHRAAAAAALGPAGPHAGGGSAGAGLTSAAPVVGPATSGVIATYPVFAAVPTVFAHRTQGAAAHSILRGLLTGLFGFTGFFFVLALLLPRAGIAAAFAGASLVALAIQGGPLTIMRRHPRVH